MTQEEASDLLIASINAVVGASSMPNKRQIMISDEQVATIMAQSNDEATIDAFCDVWQGECGCGKEKCFGKLLSAVNKCLIWKIGTPVGAVAAGTSVMH